MSTTTTTTMVSVNLCDFIETKIGDVFEKKLTPLRNDVTALKIAMAQGRGPDKDEKKNTELRLMAKGAFLFCGSLGGLIAFLFEVAKFFKPHP